MGKVISILALITLSLMFVAFVNVFGGFNISRQVASAVSGIDNIFGSPTSAGEELDKTLAEVTRTSEAQKQKLFELASSLVASTTIIKQEEDKKEDEPPIPTGDWKIFYTKPNFGGASAYTLRYPKGWVMNDSNPRTKILMYEVNGFVYSLALHEKAINLANIGRFINATSTTLGNTEYTKKSVIQAATTTLVAYITKGNPRSFSIAFGTVPPEASAKYIKIYERILSTLAVEPAEYPFLISNLQVSASGPLLTTDTAIGEPMSISWKVEQREDLDKKNAVVKLWIEDDEDKQVLVLATTKRYDAQSISYTLSASDNKKFKFGQRYRAVALGEVDGKKTNKVYSNWFTIFDAKQFTDARLIVTPSEGSPPLKVSVEASIKNSENTNNKYIVFFADGAYSVLDNGNTAKYWGQWTRTYEQGTTVRLMRTTAEALSNRFYGARTYEEVSRYADEILSTNVSVE